MADCMPKRIIEQCHDYGIVPMIGLDSCLKSLNHSYNIGLSFKKSQLPPLKVSRLLRGESNNKLLTEYEAKSLLVSMEFRFLKAQLYLVMMKRIR